METASNTTVNAVFANADRLIRLDGKVFKVYKDLDLSGVETLKGLCRIICL